MTALLNRKPLQVLNHVQTSYISVVKEKGRFTKFDTAHPIASCFVQMLSYLTSMDQDFVTALLDRIGVPGMDELLLKLMCCDSLENDEEGPFSMSVTNNYPYRIKLFEALHTYARRQRQKEEQGEESPLVTAANSTGANDMDFATVIDWWASHNVISKLIERLDPEYDSDVHTGVCYTFAEALRRSASSRTIVHMDHPIVARLHSTDIMEQLMDKILSHVREASLFYFFQHLTNTQST